MIGLALMLLALPLAWWLWERSQRRTGLARPGLQEQIDLPFEQEFELYHNAFSLCSKKVRICLAELGIDHASHHIDLIETGSYENLSRRFIAVNPQCTVPVLVHRGHPVYESHEQIRYAADHAGEQAEPLVPEDSALAAEMQVWVDRASLTGDDPMAEIRESAGNCVPGLTVPLFCAMIAEIPFSKICLGFLFHRNRVRPMMFFAMKLAGLKGLSKLKPAAKAIRSSIREMNVHLDALESKLDESGGPWILGERFSLADVSWVVIFDRMREADCADLFLGGDLHPRVTAYRDRLFARSSYAKGIWNHEHPTVRLGTERIREAKQANPRLRALLAGEKPVEGSR
ncbi:MAG: glutathione S-transferase family protein [Myxococcota bacterium]|nr:glutathione S-transferase family protein [Myxococcota bacterium]